MSGEYHPGNEFYCEKIEEDKEGEQINHQIYKRLTLYSDFKQNLKTSSQMISGAETMN